MTETSLIHRMPPPLRGMPRRRFASLRTIAALILREMTTTYGRSPGGYLWAVLEPVAGIALLSFAFSALFERPTLGINFPLFYATGVVPFSMFMGISGAVAQSINFSRPLLAYPSVTWVDAILARFILNFLTQLMVAYLILAGIMMIWETRVIVDVPTVALSLLMSGLLGLGIGTLNCFLFTRFPVWQRGWSILMRPMFLLSGVMLLYDRIPPPWNKILWYNPLMHITGLTRRGFYTSYDATYVSVVFVLGIGAICGTMGLIFLSRYHRDLINL